VTVVDESPTLAQVLEFCGEEPVERVFLEDIARRGIGRFAAVVDRRRIRALCHVGANVVPSGTGLGALVSAAARGRPRMIVGAERAVDELWDGLASHLPKPLDDRPGQPVFVLETPPDGAGTGLRRATVDDLDLLVRACAEAYREEVGIDAYTRDPELFRWRTRSQIELGRSWLWVDGGRICFKAEASAWTPAAVQLQQVWVDPVLRGRGLGRAGFADLCRLLLDRTPRVCLFARPENGAALALYDGAGMRRVGTYRSLIFS
jgi:hypothetical protein